MIPYLVCDGETTTFQKGNPYSQQNKLCLFGIKDPTGKEYIFDIEYSDNSYVQQLSSLQKLLNETTLLVLFNAKFDLAWLRRYGLDFSHCRIFDGQLAHFILSGQQSTFPSLNEVAEYHQLEQKLDTVKEQYWNQGIDTPQIPLQILTTYLQQDLLLTELVYLKQLEILNAVPIALQRLVNLYNQDLLVLLEMEYNGIKINFQEMQQKALTIDTQINQLKEDLNVYFADSPSYLRNYNSGDHLSLLLFGGTINEPIRTEVGEYKTGPKTGQPRYKVDYLQHMLPRRVEPPKGSELKKEGFYATNEETLRSIKADKSQRVLLNKLLELSKLEKLNGTYYKGIPELAIEKDWEPDYIHGQFNMCVARTGRLSSSGPNLQNFPPEIDEQIITRF